MAKITSRGPSIAGHTPGEPAGTDPGDDAVPPAASSPGPERTPKPADVRAWAAEQNLAVPARGRIPDDVLEQYRAAQDPR